MREVGIDLADKPTRFVRAPRGTRVHVQATSFSLTPLRMSHQTNCRYFDGGVCPGPFGAGFGVDGGGVVGSGSSTGNGP